MSLTCTTAYSFEGPAAILGLQSTLGFRGPLLEVPPDRRSRWSFQEESSLFYAGERQGVELLVSFGDKRDAQKLRSWTTNLAKRAPLGRYLHAQTTPEGTLLALVRPGAQRSESYAATKLDDSLATQVRELVAQNREHLCQQLADLLGREDITRGFFRAFRDTLLTLEKAWQNLDQQFDNPSCRRDLTLTLLSRLMFVTFLSQQRPLNNQKHYLRWLLEQPREGDIYTSMLRPLFFGALNTPPEERAEETSRLGELPFLNGGLFQPLASEAHNHRLTLPDELLARAIHRLFVHYRFTTREREPGSSAPCIDPEMLGQVFEALMLREERRRSGSFYTPVDLVHWLVFDLLVQHANQISTRAGAWVPKVLSTSLPHKARVDHCEASKSLLIEAERHLLEQNLSELKILDPAVGSGAFLLALADALVTLRQALAPTTEVRDRDYRYQLRRQVIVNNLYGVDLKAGAVRLCELRLWLSLLVEVDPSQPIRPLPNLDHNIRQGDSLHEPWPEQYAQRGLSLSPEAQRAIQRFPFVHGREKAGAVEQHRSAELARLETALTLRRTTLTQKLEELQKRTLDLFDDHSRTPKKAQLEAERDLLAELRQLEAQSLALSRKELPFFSYRAAFPEVFEPRDLTCGGFDLLIGNPPWVRIHDIPVEKRAEYRARFHTFQSGGSGFDQQSDLSLAFAQRSLELVRPHGLVALLMPVKAFKANYGRSLRRFILEKHTLLHFADLSLNRKNAFSAANYPAWVIIGRGSEVGPQSLRLTICQPNGELEINHEISRPWNMRVNTEQPWNALPPGPRAALERLFESGVNLRTYGLVSRMGLKTGCNSVFVAQEWRQKPNGQIILSMEDGTELSLNQDMAPLLIRGRDVKAFKHDRQTRILLPYDGQNGRIASQLEPSLEQYLQSHRIRLLQRRDHHRTSPYWALFRRSALQKGHRVLYRDIAPRLEACYLKEGEAGLPFNTTYFFQVKDPDEARLLTCLLNSSWMRLAAASRAEPANSGYLRFLAWTVEQLPWPGGLHVGSRLARKIIELHDPLALRPGNPELLTKLDDLVAIAYGLSPKEKQTLLSLTRFFPQVSSQSQASTGR